VQTIRILSHNDVAFAASSMWAEVAREPFQIQMDGTTIHVDAMADWKLGDAAQTASETAVMLDRLSYSVQVLEAEQAHREELKTRIAQLRDELQPMEEIRRDAERRAMWFSSKDAWATLAFLGFGFGFMGRLTWWEYSWDLMEPVTYFVGLGVNICFFGYYLLTHRDYSYEVAKERAELKAFYRLAMKRGVDVSRYNTVKQQLAFYRQQLMDM